MGCVLGKPLPRHPNSPADPFPPRSSEQPPTTTTNIIKDQLKVDSQYLNGSNHHQSRFPAPEKTIHGWPAWLCSVAGDSINDWTPRRANTFQKLDKIGQGTYSNVYKARDMITGEIVALKKVRFDNCEPESLKFMAREILILKKLDHPNVIKLLGLVTSRMSSSLYLVFEYMDHDLFGLAAAQPRKFTEPQVKCFMKQLLSGLEHCHNHGVLHRDIKGSNLLINNEGTLKIADFGLASFFDPRHKQPMTSRVVTLWYRPPELLLGATHYGIGVDLWSAGCILAELLAGKPIMPGRTEASDCGYCFRCKYLTMAQRLEILFAKNHENSFHLNQFHFSGDEKTLINTMLNFQHASQVKETHELHPQVEQLHKIFKLCGSPSEEYWKNSQLPKSTHFKPQKPYKRCTLETFKDFPPSSLPLIENLLAINPDERGSATAALNSEFFTTEPFACEPSSLPKYPPSKELDVKLRDDEARRKKGFSGKAQAVDGTRKIKFRDRVSRAMPAPEANAELKTNLVRRRTVTQGNGKSISEKFPPPHQDGAVGYPPETSSHKGPVSFSTADSSFSSSMYYSNSSHSVKDKRSRRGKDKKEELKLTQRQRQRPQSQKLIRAFLPSSISLTMDFRFRGKRFSF